MDTGKPDLRPNVAVFPMKQPEIQIGDPERTVLTDEPVDQEYAQNTQTWE